ncbi:Translation initiation factor 3, subunit h (eIF-3h) [Phaffia rhodozyma]|uniref:Translation initiation factor 3, subunit h (EIF-3h) n=1 Tax=Phaffia rhodozyma TaxID=264483 RepID=A0A0F7SQB4_PHARH|nr:Translation initiation factor 3, subunit h (eIF-3h) [Phaffia rhodozyma]
MASAPSLASLLSASLPASSAASASASASATNNTSSGKQNKTDGIPASLKGGLDVEGLNPINSVELDGLVIIKIIKQYLDNPTTETTGHLLGLDLNGTLEVSDSFALPNSPPWERGADEEKERASNRAAQQAYSTEMVRNLKQISAADSVVGAYFTSPVGQLFKASLVETLAIYQSVGGRKGVVLLHDPTKSIHGRTSIKAYRFSAAFAEVFSAKGRLDTQTLVDNRLTFSNLLEELPITITNSSLVTAYLSTLTAPATNDNNTFTSSPTSTIPPLHLSALNLHFPSSLTTSVEQTSRSLDEFQRENNSLLFNARDIARQKTKVDQLVASGVPEDEAKRTVKVPAEGSRLNALLLLRQIDEFAKGLAGNASVGVAKMYGAAKE